jgi:prepilin-type N-terminal cleavage/methylation domain-containing protein
MTRHPSQPARLHTRGRQAQTGFTLIELLIVVVIIGILAAIAIPKFASTKGTAEAAALHEDLRNLATVQESYFYNYAVYSMSTSDLQFNNSPGVTVTITTASATGWSASAASPLATPGTCAVFYGAVSNPATPATVEGDIACQ